MSKELFVRNNITINAPAAAVWDALVNPARTKQYMFGCETVSDWKKGSELLWKMIHEGKELIAVKGNIEEIIPGKRLIYTTIDPNSNIDDTSEKYLQVTYDLTEDNGQTLLQVSQGNYATVNEGERRFREAEEAGGWSALLEEIKKLVEAN
ncbi:hypothetical protein ECE50_019210 [Chitinophaga sp. Mgbs1]|uniref:Activator of Hsp90 ATPase homologue 1/2-like C-terminal domain-containing protein n=1 Tax=Chitinophaga solisilvae TaxID=1233460 RepID=A0A3S1B3M6_9BACT|nr:hypothetical protein [Chitinophaga solisilvae]